MKAVWYSKLILSAGIEMELDFKDFEWNRTDQNIEWWMFEVDHRDFFITINKEKSLKNIKLRNFRIWIILELWLNQLERIR